MKKTTLTVILFFTTFLLTGCGNASGKLKFLEFRDPQLGMVQHRIPLPKGWSYDKNPNDQLSLIGPNGTEVYQTSSGRFAYSNDPFALQTVQMTGTRVAPVMPIEEYLKRQFAPYMEQRGFRLNTRYPMPRIIDVWDMFAAGMPQGMSRKSFNALGAEWEHQDGTKAFTLLVQYVLQQPKFVTWEVTVGELYASAGEFESAKEAYIYASENLEVNPEWQIAKNNELIEKIRADQQIWDERSRQSRIQHLGRMNAILARGESSRSTAKINSDILDISHAGYLKRDSMISAGQAKSANLASGHSVIHNPNSGEMYKVETGANHYWVNPDGKYFGTDDALYDPRRDQAINNQEWTRFEVMR